MNIDDACCNCMSHSMVGQGDPTFVHLGMRDGRWVDHRLVVTKHHCWPINRCSEVSKCKAQINDLLSECSCSDAFRTECSRLNSRLQLQIPIDGSVVELVEDACNWFSTDKIMAEVSIKGWCHSHRLPFWFGSIQRNCFLCVSIAGVFPVTHLNWDVGAIRCVGPDRDCGMVHLGKIPMDFLDAVKVSLSRHSTEAWESHHCCLNVKATNLNFPLQSSNQRLMCLLIVFIEWLWNIQLGVIASSQWWCGWLRPSAADPIIVFKDLFNALLWRAAQHSFFVTKEVTT